MNGVCKSFPRRVRICISRQLKWIQRVFEVPSCMFPIFRHPVVPHSVQAPSKLCPSCVQARCSKFLLARFTYSVIQSCPILSKCCPSCVLAPPFLSKLATKQCREYKFLLLSGICESHSSDIQSLVATVGGLRVPQIRPPGTSHLVQSLSIRFPSCDRAPLLSDQALAKRCPSSDQAPLFSDQARPHTVLGVHVFV